ncbi:hypothetical protein [Actinoplanes sp. HUAS TT8]|uniref:hypothetical protein n=1 Tax=Actinoplanes sp. HUAS TT8 TaxID=3447453 RepID=UPI003F522E81
MGQGKRAVGPIEITGIVVVALLVVAAVVHRMNAEPASDSTANPSQSYIPLASGSKPADSEPATYGPFQGTPAQSYAKGKAGIVLPPAKAVPGFTAAEVKASLATVRDALIAARLDDKMLVKHDPSGFLATLAPSSRAEITKYFGDTRFSSVATWIDPAATLDAAEEPRVDGKITFTSVEDDGTRWLQVTTNFMWVYAFQGGDPRIAAAHDEIQWEFPHADGLAKADTGMWLTKSESYMAWVDCDAARKGLLRPGSQTGATTGPTEDPNAILDSGHGLTITDNCG